MTKTRDPGTGELHATTLVAESARSPRHRAEPEVNVLVIAWCPHEPARVGEFAVIPSTGRVQILGRGVDDEEPRLRFFRSRPGRLDPTPALSAAGLSRRQAELTSGPEGLDVRRIGQCSMRVNDAECNVATLRPGETLRFRQELLLFYERRQSRIAPLTHFDADVCAFGEPDGLGILGETPSIWALRDQLAFAAKAGAHVLLTGESGTGKELAARAIHSLASCAARPFVARNAATLPAGLIDAEVFGNVRNYPNPGMPERPGLIGQADGGTLFLDEIGELPAELHAHLLRVLDAGGEYQRLGDSTTRRSDFRLLAATNRDPAELKHDLLARMTVRVELPSLSERRADVPLLLRHLVTRAAEKGPEVVGRFVERGRRGPATVRADTRLVDELIRRDYPANARELESILWSAMAASTGDTIEWSEAVAIRPARSTRPGSGAREPSSRPARNEERSPEEVRAALAHEDGNVARAAKVLGLSSRYALYRLMTKLGLEDEES
jgi:DNA-binding NtrC family response regulator